jgi:hypothetical protein
MAATARPPTPAAIDRLVPGSAASAMLAVGVVEVAGLVVAVRPKVGGYLVVAWLAGIIGNLLLLGDRYDVALRGVRAAGARTLTSALHGLLRSDPRSRQEFLALTGISR